MKMMKKSMKMEKERQSSLESQKVPKDQTSRVEFQRKQVLNHELMLSQELLDLQRDQAFLESQADQELLKLL